MDRPPVRRSGKISWKIGVVVGVASALAATYAGTRSHRPGEGGTGYAVAAAPAAAVAPVPTTQMVESTTTTVPAGPPSTLVATLRGDTPYYASPDPAAGQLPAGTLPAHNPFGAANVLAAVGQPDAAGWLHVDLPVRPNGSTGWIQAAGVDLSETPYALKVDLATRSLTVTKGGQTVLTSSVAVGASKTPTPPGQTYVWELIRPSNPAGAYGPYILGLGWFSTAYAVFNGGDAQIGIHGQNEPWSIGQAASHGCVRLPNDVIAALAGFLPLGTPVTIS